MQKVESGNFTIEVAFNNRHYRYSILFERINGSRETFTIVANCKTVVVESNLHLAQRKVLRIGDYCYSYDTAMITNKGLMKRIINLIDQHMTSTVRQTKNKRCCQCLVTQEWTE